MISLILIMIIAGWSFLYLYYRWRQKKILAVDLPLFLLCILFLNSRRTIFITFGMGDDYKIGLSVAWLFILCWFYIRRNEIAFLFEYKPINLIIGGLAGMLFAVAVIIVGADVLKSNEISRWIPGLIFDSVQRSMAEEIVFRCLLINYLKKRFPTEFIANLTQGFLFGMFHLYGAYLQSPIMLLLPLFFGLSMGFIVLKQKSIYGSLLAHVLYNLMLIVRLLS